RLARGCARGAHLAKSVLKRNLDASISHTRPSPCSGRGADEASAPTHFGLLVQRDLLAGVLHDLVNLIGRIYSYPVILPNEDYVESTILQHAGKLSLAVADCECMCRIIPAQRNGGVYAFLVVVAVVLVFVEDEVAVGSGVNTQLDGILGFLRRPLLIRPQGQ